MNDLKVVAFDCDGVMFDSAEANRAYYNSILRHFGRPDMTEEQFAYGHMSTGDETIASLFPEPEIFEKVQAYRRTIGYFEFIRFMKMEPHLKAQLKRLRLTYKTAIATNRTDTLNRVLEEHDLKQHFDFIVSARDVAHPKPHPEQLFRILDHFQIQPGQAIYIGDSQVDQQASNAAAVPFIAFNNPSLTADFHIQSLRDLDDIV